MCEFLVQMMNSIFVLHSEILITETFLIFSWFQYQNFLKTFLAKSLLRTFAFSLKTF